MSLHLFVSAEVLRKISSKTLTQIIFRAGDDANKERRKSATIERRPSGGALGGTS
jgi:hypothetical protein